MSEPNKYREWILETIDSLRSRKARPDLERICRMVRRRHGSDPDQTRTELEKLIEEQTVLKVSYKGSISYRNAAKAQRKSRKRSEFTAAEAAKERTRLRDRPNNSGDSLTDQEEGEEDSAPSPDAHSQTSPSATSKKPQPSSSHSGGDAAGSDVGSGRKEETASAPRRNQESGRQGSDRTSSRADAVCGGEEPGWSGAQTHNKSCSGSGSILPPQQTERQTVTLKPKVGVGGGGRGTVGNHASCDLGDRSVAPVRSPSERSLRGASVAPSPTRGPAKPLGLKEICMGYLSSREEKLTRGKVRVVMEREVARGRLRRTRCGDIALPPRGSAVEGATVSADRLTKEAPQDKRASKKENEPMEAAGEEEEREENDVEEEDPRSSEEDGGLSPVAMTMEPQNLKTSAGVELLSSQQQQLGGKAVDPSGVSEPDALAVIPCPPVQGGSPLESDSLPFVEKRAVVPDQVNMEAQNQMQLDRINHNSSSFDSSESKTEIGVSSCLLTPTASPRDSGVSEERGMNGGVSSGGFMKSEVASGSPVDWTVSDVVSYFTAAGFPEQAAAFRAQEIDGKSLLLMQRNDVLTGLSIRLGPALKIYERHVKVLQKMHFEEDDS